MGSDEERLEEMLRAVMGAGDAADNGSETTKEEKLPLPEIPGIEEDLSFPETPETSDELSLPEIPGMEEDPLMSGIPGIEEDLSFPETPETSDELSLPEIPGMEEDPLMSEIPGMEEDLSMPEMPETEEGGPTVPDMGEDLSLSEAADNMSLADIEEELSMPEFSGDVPSNQKDEMLVDPLALLDMSEDEVDQVLEKEAGMNRTAPGQSASAGQSDAEIPDLSKEDAGLSDLTRPDGMGGFGEDAEGGMSEDFPFGDVDLDSESVQSLLGLGADAEEEASEIPAEPEVEMPKESDREPEEKTGKEKKKKEKKSKKTKKSAAEGKEKKEGFGKRLAALFFGQDDDELDDAALSTEGSAEEEEGSEEKQQGGKAAGKAGKAKAEKKKKEKKKKPEKKNEPDPKKAAKEKQKKEKNAEKAKKKAEKAEQAEKERRAAKKLPKKKVFVWILLCASIAAGILLMNSVGMDTLHLTEARNAFDDKDFETAYKLLNGRNLAEEDQLLFRQSSAVLHLKHAKEAYENHIKLKKPVMALEDLLKGVDKYQQLRYQESLVTPELTAQYNEILKILQEEYALSESGAIEINALESDYEFSLQLEALAAGEVYQSEEEIARQEEEAASDIPELEDMLPEEEEYLNDSGN